jgi:hypothetical protein
MSYHHNNSKLGTFGKQMDFSCMEELLKNHVVDELDPPSLVRAKMKMKVKYVVSKEYILSSFIASVLIHCRYCDRRMRQ